MPSQILTAEWKNLIMANYIIDPAVLIPFLPRQTELDLYQGNHYISLVGFMFADTRVLGVPIPFHINFEEVNLRFYVRYNDKGQWKRGTVFIKEIVPKAAISFMANTIYHEKYCTKKMDHFIKITNHEINLGYHWKHHDKWNKLEATTGCIAQPMQAGSEEEFIAEHYWGYSKYDATTTFEYNVQHPAWQIYPVKDHLVDCDFSSCYGHPFAALQHTEPHSVFVAAGSPISVMKKRTL